MRLTFGFACFQSVAKQVPNFSDRRADAIQSHCLISLIARFQNISLPFLILALKRDQNQGCIICWLISWLVMRL
jgi:hypothetical protein